MKILKWLDDNFEESLLMVLLLLMTVIMGIQITARYAFKSSLTWSEEITRYLFIWSAFLSISYCIKKQISIKIDQVVNMAPPKPQRILKIIEKIILLVFFVYMIYFAVDYLSISIRSGQVSPACGIPMYYVQLAPLVGFSLTSIRITQNLIYEFKNLNKNESLAKGD